MPNVYLSLGTNLGNKSNNINRAIELLQEQVGDLILLSALYQSEPWGFESENSFLNAAALFHTELKPLELLTATQKMEQKLGRKTKSSGTTYSDRIIDIDILFYDDLVIKSPKLTIPHPHIASREFVLHPLEEIAPNLRHPILKQSISELYLSLKQIPF